MKNKMIVGIIVVILVVLGGWFLLMKSSNSSVSPDASMSDESQNIKKINPEDIGLTMELKPDKKAVIVKVTKLDDVKSLDYELSYDVEDTIDGETTTAPKGAISTVDVNGEGEISREILLGTCSGKVCRYDKVVSDIKILVKVNYSNGDKAAAESTLKYSIEE